MMYGISRIGDAGVRGGLVMGLSGKFLPFCHHCTVSFLQSAWRQFCGALHEDFRLVGKAA